MTDDIDLDDIDVASDDDGNRGDWFWDGAETDADPDPEPADDSMRDEPVPRVPRENEDKPAGIPVEQGGAGAGPTGGEVGDGGVPAEDTADHGGGSPAAYDDGGSDGPAPGTATRAAGSAAHGGDPDPDGMTMALTFEAVKRLDDPRRVLASAAGWADWVGIVGEVEAHVINKFQREHDLDVDFFNGSGTDPVERLSAIGPHSMFYATRMVVVGLPDDAHIAEDADWEFVPLSEAAAEADWSLAE
ncbi:MAG: hypothetical protein ABEJ68_05715 [Halobacteriaceae archaeon]